MYKLNKSHIGGVYTDINYVSHGAENIVFKLNNNEVIRIFRKCDDKHDLDKLKKLKEIIDAYKPLYFMNINKIDTCEDLRDKFNNDINMINNFCNENKMDKQLLCDYQYITSNYFNGINIIDYIINFILSAFVTYFFDINTEIINIDENINRINLLVRILLRIYINICDAYIDFNNKTNKFFKHNDLHCKNILINIRFLYPYIIDYDSYEINDKDDSSISDILQYIGSINSYIQDKLEKYENDILLQNFINILDKIYTILKVKIFDPYYHVYKLAKIKNKYNIHLFSKKDHTAKTTSYNTFRGELLEIYKELNK
jgi:hypothetical protein